MKYVRWFLTLFLLIVSRRNREKWHEAAEHASAGCGALDAAMRRLDAEHNGGKPRLHRVG